MDIRREGISELHAQYISSVIIWKKVSRFVLFVGEKWVLLSSLFHCDKVAIAFVFFFPSKILLETSERFSQN